MRETMRIGEIEAWLYRPEGAPRAAIVVAPGLCGTKAGPLEAFAEAFAQAGYAVLSLDFRGFGGSGGEPRQFVDPVRQVEDYLAAIEFVRSLNLPIVLWGTSFSGTAAICAAARAAARAEGIAAVIAQIPWLGGVPVHAPSRLDMARYVTLSLLDMMGAALGFPAITIRAYGRPGERAFAVSEQNFDHPFWKDLPPWENRMAVRGLKHLDAVSARDDLPRLTCPVLVMAAMRDDMIRFEDLRAAAASLPAGGSRFIQFDCGHFDPYVAPFLSRNLRAQIEFLDAMFGHDSRLETERLILRGWRPDDFEALAAIHGDPDVMTFLGGVMDRSDAWRSLASLAGHWVMRGYGKWAVERKSDGAMIGRVGLINPEGWPGIEVGWTLGSRYWGKGYATEAAVASMNYAFLVYPIDRLISCIDPGNAASQEVARRIGETKGESTVLRMGGKDFPVDIWAITRGEWMKRARG